MTAAARAIVKATKTFRRHEVARLPPERDHEDIMKPRLFIGSSSEKLLVAHEIQRLLEHVAEVTVWDQNLSILNHFILEALEAELQKADFAAFVLAPDDVTNIRGRRKKTVRDNVVFELGLYIGRLSRQRSFMIMPRGWQQTMHLPMDLMGLIPAEYDATRENDNPRAALQPACLDIARAIEKLGFRFPRPMDTDRESRAYALYSPHSFADELERNLLGDGWAGWGQRALYAGVDGAKSWLSVSAHPDYAFDYGKLRSSIDRLLAAANVGTQTVVSLGPGDGQTDAVVLESLAALMPHKEICYIPIDISEGLLFTTMKQVRYRLPQIRMPFGILGDFEYGWPQLDKLLPHASPKLYILIGNTISNLDQGLESFFGTSWGNLRAGDLLLFDVLLGDFDSRLGSDALGMHDANNLFRDGEVWTLYRQFIAQGARRISRDQSVYDDACAKLSTALQVMRSKNEAGGYDQLHLLYRRGNDVPRTIFKWRRYLPDTKKLESWLSRSLSDCSIVGSCEIEDGGDRTKFMLLRKTR